jgi:phage shock protein C
MSEAKLRAGFLSEMQRYPNEGWIAGVCAGIADYFNWKVQVVRLIAVLLAIFTAFWIVLIIYCVLWYVMDEGSMQDPDRPNYRGYPPRGPSPSSPSSTIFDTGPAGSAPAAPGASMSELKARFARLEERLRNMEECVTSKDFELRQELKRLES